MRQSDEKIKQLEEKHIREKEKLQIENKSYKERLETVKAMNTNLQKHHKASQKKLEQMEFLNMKCSELQMANSKLVTILWQKEQGYTTGDRWELQAGELRLYRDIVRKYNMEDDIGNRLGQLIDKYDNERGLFQKSAIDHFEKKKMKLDLASP